jgi:hypothetical protein
MTHCWTSRLECCEWGSDEWFRTLDEEPATCLLAEGHEGPHEWTPDEEIVVEFVPVEPRVGE